MIGSSDDNLLAVMWAGVGALVVSIIRWIGARLIVPRDAVTKKYLDDLAKDVTSLGEKMARLEQVTHSQGERIARLEGSRH